MPSPQATSHQLLDVLPDLAVFVRVAELRSFSAAARELDIAKSAVSRRISELEARLGARLLSRSTRNIGLTTDGMQVFEHARALVAEGQAALDAVAGSGTKPRGVVRVNAPSVFGQRYLTPAVGAFLVQQPEVEVHLTVDDRLVDVVEGGWDVVVRISKLTDSALIVRRLTTDRSVIVASPSYLERRGRPGEVCDLVSHDCIRYSLIPLELEWGFKQDKKRVAVPVRVRMAANDGGTIREAALAGVGLAALPWFMVADDVLAGRLELVLDGLRSVDLTIAAVLPQREGMPARTRAFVDHLVKWFAKPPWPARP